MKKTILGILAVSFLMTMSCKKSNTNTGGSWTFKSVTYSATSCAQAGLELIVDDNTPTNPSQLGCYFNSLPTSSGSYTVVSGTPFMANQAQITMNGGVGGYVSTGGNGAQTVNVSVSNGKIGVSGSGITMSIGSDSSTLSLNVMQTQ